jgi:uncharacterized cysteine cluster protein YcgN (CxxCxxCC family)
MSPYSNPQSWLEAREREWETLCTNCGTCCGAGEDPCEHLQRDPAGKYFCDTYRDRLGIHRTISGESMVCVPIRQKLGISWPGDERCGYKKRID